ITGAGPIGIMAAAVVRHAAARHVVVTDLNPVRLDLARKMGATLAIDPTRTPVREAQKLLGMTEGFDVGLEMSGSTAAFREVIFNMLTIKGIYGREMYETWYKMTVMVESGLDITPVITHRLRCEEFEKGF